MSPRWIHWSAKPRSFGPEFPRACRLQHGSKPEVGRPLWVSDENDYGWREWCNDEKFMLSNLKHAYEVTFKPSSRVLQIGDREQLLEFTRVFLSQDPQFKRYESDAIRTMFLDWGKVAAKFDAVLITPYQWDSRLQDDCRWYYGWDCASGVVMDPVCIESWIDVSEEIKK